MFDYAALAMETAERDSGELRIIKWTIIEVTSRCFYCDTMYILVSHGRLFDHGVMVKALQNDKEVRNSTGLECDCLQLDCLRESA